MSTVDKTPSSITGGCLCGGVRYEVNFSPDHDWKAQPHSCQCTQCRKQAGSLIIHWHTVTASEFKWTTKTNLGEYSHTPGRHRFFCQKCGGFLAWQDDADGGDIEFTVGTVDEKWLIGEKSSSDDVEATDGYGLLLADPEGTQFWSGKMIKGATDFLPGKKK